MTSRKALNFSFITDGEIC